MLITETSAYRKAFAEFMRRGTPIELSLKAAAQDHPSTHYIWRTRGDGKVRTSHAVNNGRILSWDNPPPAGHPGEDYNCRCTAEPYVRGVSEFAYQTLTSPVNDSSPKWEAIDFVWHAVIHGDAVNLSEIGRLWDVIDHYAYVAKGGVFERINRQVIDAARLIRNGYFPYDFSNSYAFKEIAFPFGNSTVFGIFKGHVSGKNGLMKIDGTVEYFFDDDYTDPAGIRQRRYGTSDPTMVDAIERYITDGGGGVYGITGQWQTVLRAEAKLNENDSRYKWSEDER